jgi:hypothetical protein
MKKFPIYKQTNNQIVNTETVQDNNLHIGGELNGGLDSANMPRQGLDYKNFVAPRTTEVAQANLTTVTWTGESQKYKEVRRWNWEHGSPADWDEQLMTIDLKTVDWNKGWNDLREYSGWDNFQLDMDTYEGFLNGHVNIDYHHGYNTVTYSTDAGTFRVNVGYYWECQWGVFLNGALIAESGPLVTYGHNIVIPFGVGVGAGPARITIAWKATTSKHIFTEPSTPADPTTPLEMFGATIWARNTRR